MSEKILIEVDELMLAQSKRNFILIDTRSLQAYDKSHIPGAINIQEIFTYISLPENGGHEGMVAYFEKTFSEKGINTNDPIIIYEDAMDNGYGQSCRGWFLFNYLGHKAPVKVLHGGIKAWIAKNLPTDTTSQISQSILSPSLYTASVNPDIMVTKEEMLRAIDNPTIIIVDVRDYAEWVGANSSPYGYDYCPRKGRIPNAHWLEWYRLMSRTKGIPWFKTSDEIHQICTNAGLSKEKMIYLYCFKGARTSNVMVALKSAGYQVKNYLNSWNEWSRDFSLPIVEDYPDTSIVND